MRLQYVLVRFVNMSNLGNERVVRIRVREQRADAEEDLRYGESRRPLLLQNVEADGSLIVHVRVVDLGLKGNLRRLERVVRREVDLHKEYAALVRARGRAHDGRLPLEQIVLNRASTA